MGNDANASDGARKGRSRKGSASQASSPFAKRGNSRVTGSLEDVPGLARIVTAVVEDGRAMLIGHTRDGGAWCVQVLDGDNRFKDYAAHQDELDALFSDLWECYGKGAVE